MNKYQVTTRDGRMFVVDTDSTPSWSMDYTTHEVMLLIGESQFFSKDVLAIVKVKS